MQPIVSKFHFTDTQLQANDLITSQAKHILLYGGARSGKTFKFCWAIFTRALKEDGSKHCMLRYRFNHAKQSLVYGTIPKMIELCYPELHPIDRFLNKSDWFYKLPNGSEIWIGGVDDKERTEKILGNEYSTIYMNECSQIPFSSVTKVRTRLAEKNSLVNKFYYDENPPSRGHWTHKEFIEGVNPVDGEPLDTTRYAAMQMNPDGNLINIDEEYMIELESLPESERNRFLYGLFGDAVTGAVYGKEMAAAYKENRVRTVLYDSQYPVHTWWDLGRSDYTAIWFAQYVGNEVRLIDYEQANKQGLGFYWELIKEKGYNYSDSPIPHNLPHDAAHKTLIGNGKSISDMFRTMGMKNIVHKVTQSVANDIFVTRQFLSRCVWDQTNCREGLECLEAYHYDYDEKAGIDKAKPVHDWSSHGCDSFRGLAVGYYDTMGKRPSPHSEGEMTFYSVLDSIRQDRGIDRV